MENNKPEFIWGGFISANEHEPVRVTITPREYFEKYKCCDDTDINDKTLLNKLAEKGIEQEAECEFALYDDVGETVDITEKEFGTLVSEIANLKYDKDFDTFLKQCNNEDEALIFIY